MTLSLIISLDIGTTSTKATIFDTAGIARDSFYQTYSLTKKADGTATQDPEEILQAVMTTLKEALDSHASVRTRLKAVSFSSAMHSLIGLDKDNHPLTPVITWADTRANPYAEALKKKPIGLEIYNKTGMPIHPMTPLSKIMWLTNEHSELAKKISLYTSIKEYIFFRFFGEHLVDYSIASGTGLFNIHSLKWDSSVLDYIGLNESQLPKACSPKTQLRNLEQSYKDYFNLPDCVPFILGASDGALANLGTNCLTPEKANLTVGTSAALRFTVKKPLLHPKGETFCYLLDEGYWVIGGAANNGGMIIDWARKNLPSGEISYEEFMFQVELAPVGADSLFFHSYLTGERAPLWNGEVRGSFTGLSLSHTQSHLFRAVLEGICFNVADIFQSLHTLVPLPKKISASGGFSHSPVWRQLMTDIIGQPISFPATHESSGLGAMILAMRSLGDIKTYEEINQWDLFSQDETEKVTTPTLPTSESYQKLFVTYQKLKELTIEQAKILAKSNT